MGWRTLGFRNLKLGTKVTEWAKTHQSIKKKSSSQERTGMALEGEWLLFAALFLESWARPFSMLSWYLRVLLGSLNSWLAAQECS